MKIKTILAIIALPFSIAFAFSMTVDRADNTEQQEQRLAEAKQNKETLETLQKMDDTLKLNTIELLDLTNDIIALTNKKGN